QFASHEWARLSFDRAGRVIGAAQAISRLTSLTHTALCWYAFLGVILVLLLSVGGFMFFSLGPAYSTELKWAWFALCGGIGLNFVFLPVFYLLQGCNQVAEFWLYRLWQQILNNVSLGIAIVVGAGLWASPVAAFVSVVWSGCFLWYAYPRFVPSLMVQTLGQQIRWWKEIWLVQWRIVISWPSSYFIIFSFAPILFVVRGPGEAGQIGIMTSISSVLLALSSNWVVTRAPRFGVLVAQKKFSELDRLFINSFIMSCIVATIGAVTIVGCIYLLSRFGHPLASRLLGPIPTAVLLLATVGNLCVSN